MIFRLSDKSLLTLEDRFADLSDVLQEIYVQHTPKHNLKDGLLRDRFPEAQVDAYLARVDQLQPDTLTDDDMKALMTLTSPWNQQLAATPEFKDVVTSVCEHGHKYFHERVHTLLSVDDETMRLVVKFLQIDVPERSKTMFASLPVHMQNFNKTQNHSRLADVMPLCAPYEALMNPLNRQQLEKLSQACLNLGITPLLTLVGCFYAKELTLHSLEQVRQKFNIQDPKYRDPTTERLLELMKQAPWMPPLE